jgi:hypothetical protein
MIQATDIATLPTILHMLESLAKHNKFRRKIMLGIMALLGASGVSLLSGAIFSEGAERVGMLVGGTMSGMMMFLPYNEIQSLRRQDTVITMVAAVIDRFQHKIATETLTRLVGELLQDSLRRRT